MRSAMLHRCQCLAVLLGAISLVPANAADQDWPQWRGPDASGTSMSTNPPTTWSESEHVKWKVAVPGIGSSTPIVLGDRVYVSTAVKTDRLMESLNADSEPQQPPPSRDSGRGGPGGRRFGGGERPKNYYQYMVIAFDRNTGAEVWRTTLADAVPHEGGHSTNTHASSSPITDGQRLYMSFGSRGVFCLDLNGKQLWSVDLGKMQTRNQFGEGSSPAVHDNTLVVPWDHEGESFLAALDTQTGTEKWRVPRDEPTTWATPLITEYNGQTQVITNGTNRVRSYDLANGELIWQCGGQATNPIPSPVRNADNVIVMTGYRGYVIHSIPLNSKGDITDSDSITWIGENAAPYVSSPVLYQGQLYFVKSNNAILVSRSAADGSVLIDETRLPEISSVYASPVAAADRIYVTGRDGTTVVLKHGNTFEVLAINKLDDEVDASAAIVDNEILIRSKSHLYCIADP